jgi:imidazolonepropionase-like amidohydrolase
VPAGQVTDASRYALAALLCAMVPAAHAGPQSPQMKAIRLASLWGGSAVIPDALVIVEGQHIVRVESGARTAPAGAELIDLRPYVGIPGLIDLHTHITYYWDRAAGTRPLGQPRRRPAVTVFLAQENARRTLETGVTTIRDLGAQNDTDFAMRDLIAMGAMTGPRMLAAGQGISARSGAAPDLEAMQRAVEERVKSGSDWIKVYASRGSFDSVDTTQTIGFAELKAIVDKAHALGRKVAVHSYGASGVKDAVRAGADSVEHGIDLDDETLAEMAGRGTVWVPTIDHNRYYVEVKDEYGFADAAIAPLQDYIARNLASAQRAWKAGVRIGMGSDAVFSMFGQNTRELEWFVKAGMTPEQALRSATAIGAELIGQDKVLGRVQPGFAADLVAIEGNPLADIAVLRSGVRWVMKDGKVAFDGRASR